MKEYQAKNRAKKKAKEINIKKALDLVQKMYDRQKDKSNQGSKDLLQILELLK